jgi:hypothetical protein
MGLRWAVSGSPTLVGRVGWGRFHSRIDVSVLAAPAAATSRPSGEIATDCCAPPGRTIRVTRGAIEDASRLERASTVGATRYAASDSWAARAGSLPRIRFAVAATCRDTARLASRSDSARCQNA